MSQNPEFFEVGAPSRDARDPVRALLGVQALDIMGSRTPRGGGGFDCRNLARGGVSIAGFPDFRARSARNGAEGAVLENFEDFSKILPN